MGWRLKHRKRDNKWRVWTTISEGWITNWLTEDEVKEFLAEEYQIDYRLRVIEAYMTFPEGRSMVDDDIRRRRAPGEKTKAFREWQSKALDSEDYEAEIAKKYQELTGRTV